MAKPTPRYLKKPEASVFMVCFPMYLRRILAEKNDLTKLSLEYFLNPLLR